MLTVTTFVGYSQDPQLSCYTGLFCSDPVNHQPSLKTAYFTVYHTTAIPYYKTAIMTAPFGDVHYKLNKCGAGCPSTPDKCAQGTEIPPVENTDALYYYVYYPAAPDGIAEHPYNNYGTCPLPAIIMFHSGGYSECSTANQADVITMCTDLAARGFVVFDVNYRVGVLADPRPIPGIINPQGPSQEYVSAQQILAIYRACQDARGAIRTIIQNNATSSPYKISTANIFVGGMSAGSLMAMNAVYYQNQSMMIDPVFPNGIGTSAYLGPMDADYYAAPPTMNYFPKIKGVLNMWGSMFIPKATTGGMTDPWTFLSQATYKPPIISFAGVMDYTFDIHQQPIYFTQSGNNLTKTYCSVNYSLDFSSDPYCFSVPYTTPVSSNPWQYGIGSETIYHAFDDAGIFAELYLDCSMGHGLDNDCDCDPSPYNKDAMNNCTVACTYGSDFASGATDQAGTYDYIAARAATFFQAILTGTQSVVVNKKFVDVKNNRWGCSAPDNPTTIHNSTCDADPHP